MASTISANDIAARLQLKKYPRSWRGLCPSCLYAGNTLSVRQRADRRPTMFCVNGCTRQQLDDAIGRVIEGWKPEPATADDNAAVAAKRARKQEAAMRLWSGSEPHGHERYLAARGLADLQSDDLRFRGDCPHPEGGRLPAMVALVRGVTGEPAAVHRTYLQRDGGGKADAVPDKASLGPVWGEAVRLAPAHEIDLFPNLSCTRPQLVIGEGIESSGSAGRLLNLPSWAALSAGNLAKGLVLPPSIRSVVIAADRDPVTANGKFPGQDAAQAAARRWRGEGRVVRIAMPDTRGDFNDLLRGNPVG